MAEMKNIQWKGETRKIPVRDTQRQRLYDAEREAFGRDFSALIDGGSFESAVAFAEKVRNSATFAKLAGWCETVPAAELEYRDGRGCRWARGSQWHVTLPRWARTKPVILHELAHTITPEDPAHGWQFAAVYMELIGAFIGGWAKTRLKTVLKKRRVRFAPPKQMSPETLAKLRERGHQLAAARRKEKEGK